MKVKCLIIGSGPAGYTAAIYASRANLAPVLIEGPQLGGQLTTTTEVENFPGYPDGIDPFTMMDDMRRQAERFGTQFVSGIVTKVELAAPVTGNPSPVTHKVWVEDTDLYEADAVIIATGASAKYLGIESERTYRGRGVSACATCDGFFYRKKTVAVVGGGDTACEEANYLAGLCEKVYMIVRKPYLRASEIMQQRVLNNPTDSSWRSVIIRIPASSGISSPLTPKATSSPKDIARSATKSSIMNNWTINRPIVNRPIVN